MKRAKWLTMLFTVLAVSFAFSACSSDSDDEPPIPKEDVDDEDDTPKVAVAGKWRGTVYENGESLDDWVTIELGNDMSYKDYNNSGQLTGSGSYTYSGNTINVPSGYISNDWGNTYTVTISGNNMKWTNATMKKWNCEYRFTKQ